MVNIKNKYYTICDNVTCVDQLTVLLNDDYHRMWLHKSTE